MNLGLKDKRALVLGASSGLGKGIAHCLVQEGARVAICSRSAANLEKTAKEIGAHLCIAEDLNREGAARKVVGEVLQKWGGIEVLVVNTGGPPKGLFEEIGTSAWKEGFQTLWLSAVDSIQASLPAMKAQKYGRILLVTSVAAKEPLPALTISNGLRAGLLGLAKSLSHEVASFGITINALLPGYTDTERLRELAIPAEKMLAGIPAKRLGTIEEFGALATFLASEQAGYITGQTIAADGGAMRGI